MAAYQHPDLDSAIEGLGESTDVTHDDTTAKSKRESGSEVDAPPISIKEITKKLIRPYAAITFFHPAVLIALDELDLYLTDWNDCKTAQYARGLVGTFRLLARSIKVHTDHQMNGLYPEIRTYLEIMRRRRSNHQQHSKVEMQLALTQIQMFMAEHDTNIQYLRNIGECITVFAEKVKEDGIDLEDNEEVERLFQNVTESIKSWIPKYKQQISEETEFLKPWIPKIAANKVDEIKLVKGIIDSNREGILRFQFGFVVSKLVTSGDWTCTIKKDQYTRNETLAAYIRCFQMTSTEEEYQKILKLIPNYIPKDIWTELKLYGLDQPGSFRFSQTKVEAHITNVCSQNVTCVHTNDNEPCRIL